MEHIKEDQELAPVGPTTISVISATAEIQVIRDGKIIQEEEQD